MGDPPAITALVLAAGSGTRFGGDKLAAELAGRPLLTHAVEPLLIAPGLARVRVVVDAAAAEPMLPDGVELVRCADAGDGISASLRAGIDVAADCDAVLVALGDEPLLSLASIAAVLEAYRSPRPAARAFYDGRPGHPVLIKRALFDRVRSLRGDRGAGELLKAAGLAEIDCTGLAPGLDVDTAADLERARRSVIDRSRA